MFRRKQRPESQQPPQQQPPYNPNPQHGAPAPAHNYAANHQQGYGNPNGYTNGHAQGYQSNPYQSGGYPQQPPPPPMRIRAPPPGADPRLWQFFNNVDTDGSGAIDVHELQRALINSNWSQFDLDTVKMLMNIFDTDRSGTIGFNEFAGLYKYIEDWQNVFRHWDKDRSGSIEERELAGALSGFGYNLPPPLVKLLLNKYSNQPEGGWGSAPQSISFDRFLRACVAVKELTEAFRACDRDNDGWIQINYDQFMNMFLKAP